jgi:hypothetical protein
VPFASWRTLTSVALLHCDRMSAPMMIKRAMNREVFCLCRAVSGAYPQTRGHRGALARKQKITPNHGSPFIWSCASTASPPIPLRNSTGLGPPPVRFSLLYLKVY